MPLVYTTLLLRNETTNGDTTCCVVVLVLYHHELLQRNVRVRTALRPLRGLTGPLKPPGDRRSPKMTFGHLRARGDDPAMTGYKGAGDCSALKEPAIVAEKNEGLATGLATVGNLRCKSGDIFGRNRRLIVILIMTQVVRILFRGASCAAKSQRTRTVGARTLRVLRNGVTYASK